MFLTTSNIKKYHHSAIILGLALTFSGVFTLSSQAADEFDKNTNASSQSKMNKLHGDNTPNIPQKETIIASNLQVLPATLNLVKQFEGFRSYSYFDTSGLPVIGYGQTRINGRTVTMGQYISQAQADVALEQELYHIQSIVLSHVKVDVNPHQLGALTSLVFNAGTGILTNSTLIRKLNAGDYAGAANEFPRWNKAHQGGRLVVFPGLTRRRLEEKKLFLTPYNHIASN
ncbi:lysozyme [Pleurocapsa sp. PCC 7319]|uniref:lysozyme n=1 Tax=Pleurocapsa sp. PCC 7319 TaxID=118161 RepID=UPI00034D7837|nr:lysozyme [Pleurocapsa sp. PCC 7319]